MLSRLNFYLRYTLGMTRQEIRGVIVLCLFIGLGMLAHAWLQYNERKQVIAYLNPIRFEVIYTRLEEGRKIRQSKIYPKSVFLKSTWVPRKQEVWSIDINAADSLAWVALPGIGPGFAKRILKYKAQLGGFFDISQLKEVYGIDTVWVERYRNRFKIGAGVMRKLYVNRLLWQEFRHPYLPYAQVKVFLNYRKQHGVVRDYAELGQIKLLDMHVWDRLRPYLAFDP